MNIVCEKAGCQKEAANKIRFTDLTHVLDTDGPIALCEEHTSEADRFDELNVIGLKRWLKSVS